MKKYQASTIPEDALPCPPKYDDETVRVLSDALVVYDRLSPWALRCESHLEAPWKAVEDGDEINFVKIWEHFSSKFQRNQVELPTFLGRSSYVLDGLPTSKFATLHDMAETVRAMR